MTTSTDTKAAPITPPPAKTDTAAITWTAIPPMPKVPN